MKYKKIALLCLTVCATAQMVVADTLDGIWKSDGYGMIAEVKDGKARAYQISGDICMRESARWERLSSFLEGINITPEAGGQTALLAAPFAQHRIRVHRIPALPAACARPAENTPLGNFDTFAAVFAENYAFFDLYDVNWPARVEAARAKVRPDMSDTELFRLMTGLLAPLRDGHLELNGRDGRKKLTFEPNIGRTHRALLKHAKAIGRDREDVVDAFHEAYWKDNIRSDILQGGGVLAGNKRVQYGVVNGDIGYLALVTVAGYSRSKPDPKRDLKAINEIMETALQGFRRAGVRAVVIDLSVNYGGFDFVSRAIAERFAAERTHAYTKYAGDADDPIRTRVMLTPSDGTRFEGPVYVMTSNVTISGGEILTLALRALPNVTHIGERTRGALSDVLDKTLPNGWEVSLSNEVYLDSDGIAWEGQGIQPEREMTVFPEGNPAAGHLSVLRQVLGSI